MMCLVAVLLIGCGVGAARQNAEALAEKYFRAAAIDDPSPVFALYNEAFYSATPKEEWRSEYAALRAKLGKPTEHTLSSLQTHDKTLRDLRFFVPRLSPSARVSVTANAVVA